MPEHENIKIEESVKLKQFLIRCFSSWHLFVITLSISLVVGLFYLRITVPIYLSKATVEITDEKKGIDNSKVLRSLDLFSSSKLVENEIEVLHSRAIMEEVVRKLCLYAPITDEGALKSSSAYITSPIIIQLKDPEHLKEQSKIYFNIDFYQGTKWVIIGKQFYPLNVWVDTEWGLMKFLSNSHYKPSNGAKKLYFSLISFAGIADNIVGGMEVAPVSKLSTVVTLTIKDQVPQRGNDILNAVITEYNQAAIQYKNTLAANALSFVEGRLHFVEDELDSVEQVIQHYKTSQGIVDISEQSRKFLRSIEDNDQRISQINVQLAVLDQIESSVNTKNDILGINPSTLGLNDATLNELLSKLYNVELEYERLKMTTGENNSLLTSLRNQIEKIKPGLLENVRNQRNNLLASKQNLNETSGHYSSVLGGMPEKERQLLDITRQQMIKNNIYTFLLEKREDAALSFAASVADSRLIDRAESGAAPVSPSKVKVLTVAFIISLMIPMLFILAKQAVANTIIFQSDIRTLCSYLIVGEVTYNKSPDQFILLSKERSYIAEQIRQIRTFLSSSPFQEGKARTILVTSTTSGEGKTFIAVNTAISIALTEKSVVLVELDLRKPSLSKILNVKYKEGVVEYFKKIASTEQIIYSTAINNLDLIPVGSNTSYPSELISNGRIDELIASLQEKYDYVIIDTAPTHPFSDAYIISKLCDTTLLIIRQNMTLKQSISSLCDNQSTRVLKNVAIIFNGIKRLSFDKLSHQYTVNYKD